MQASRNTWIGGAGGGLLDGMVYAMGEMVVEGIRSVSVEAVFGFALLPHSPEPKRRPALISAPTVRPSSGAG